MTRVYVDMVADLFHYGHVELLARAKALGDFLLVGIHSDETVERYKRPPILTMEERVRVVAGCRHVDEVLPDAPLDVDGAWLDMHAIDLVVHGDDLDEAGIAAMYAVPAERGILRTVPYTAGISTTVILERIARRFTLDGLA